MTYSLNQADKALLTALQKQGITPKQVEGWNPVDGGLVAYASRVANLNEVTLLENLSTSLELPMVRVNKSNFGHLTHSMNELVTRGVDIQFWRENHAAPCSYDDKNVEVAVLNPFDTGLLQKIKYLLKLNVQPILIAEEELLALLEGRLATSQDLDFDNLLRDATNGRKDFEVQRLESSITSASGDAPVIQAVNKVLADAIRANASDIHINPGQAQTTVKIRVDGMLQDLCTLPATAHSSLVSRLKLLAGMDIAEKRKPQDGRLRIKTPLGVRDLRLASVPTLHGENMVIRVQNGDVRKITLEELAIDELSKRQIELALKSSSRVILVTGPTGSGKTSTLYAGLLHIHDGSKNIVTIEDPIEHRIPGINQTQVNQKIGVGFAEGLRSMLRQDPDVIMVGEVRDAETATIAMQAAQTGHLVLSTLHANSASAALTRLYDLGIAPYLVASSLGAIVAQRLVRKLCPQCKEKQRREKYDDGFIAGRGCDECSGTGYRGRAGIYSVLTVSEEVRRLIRESAPEQDIELAAAKEGFRSLAEQGLKLVESGETSIDELERVIGSLPDSATHHTGEAGKSDTNPNHVHRRKLLLVEDDDSVRNVMGMLFEREMYEVSEAEHGLDALEKIYLSPPDIIVSDLMMPQCDGLKFLKKLRADKRLKHIPVLMLTAANSEENELILLEHGADDFVPKSSDARILIKRVERLLAGS